MLQLPPDSTGCMQGNSVGASTVSDLFTKDPTVRSPVSGYHVVAGSYPSALLTPGTTLPTVDVVRNAGRPDTPVTLQITAPGKVLPSATPQASVIHLHAVEMPEDPSLCEWPSGWW